jgi:hypothetical protein
MRIKRFIYGGTVNEWKGVLYSNFCENGVIVECEDGGVVVK